MGKRGKKSRPGSSHASAREHGKDHHVGSHWSDKDQASALPGDDDESSQEEIAQEMSSQVLDPSNGERDAGSGNAWEQAGHDVGSGKPQTCCSHCQTIFEVSVGLLSSVDTRVRCGECNSIFDALANLRDGAVEEEEILVDADGNVIEPNTPSSPTKRHLQDTLSATEAFHEASSLPSAGAAALAGLTNDTTALDVTYSDFDLFSEDAGLPEVAYFDQTRETPGFEFDEVDDSDETFNDTLFAQDATLDARTDSGIVADAHDLQNIALNSDVDFITDEAPREALIFNYRERETRTSSNDSSVSAQVPFEGNVNRPAFTGVDRGLYNANGQRLNVPDDTGSSWLLRGCLLFLLMSLAGGLYVYRERNSLYTNQFIRPVLEVACSVLKCSLPEQIDLSAIKVLKRAVFSHPTIKNALIINLGFVNEAAFSQRYPVLEIRLTDRSGGLVVKNNFLPADYTSAWREGDKLDAGKRLDISLTVEDPGNTATSFELDFR